MDREKRQNGRHRLKIMALVAGVLSLAVILQILPYRNEHKTEAPPIGFTGVYQTADMPSPEPLGPEGMPSAIWNSAVTLRGQFDRPLMEGEQLLFLMEYLEVRVCLGEEELFSFGAEADYPSVAYSSGMSWGHCIIPRDVAEGEQFTITLRSKYQNNYYSAYADFLDSLCTGDSGALARRVLGESGLLILLSASFFFVSLIMLGFGLLLALQGLRIHSSVYRFACFAMAVSMWIFLNPKYITLIFDNTVLVMQLETVCMLLAAALLPAYLLAFLKTTARRVNGILLHLSVALAAAIPLLQLLGLTDAYAIRTFLTITFGLMTFVCAGGILYEIRHNKQHELRFLVVPGLIFLFCAAVEMLNYGLELFPMGKVFFAGFFVLMTAQLILAVRYIKMALLLGQQAAELERQLTESRVATMLSQIQPHFLYNALDCIGELCVIDPARAEWAVTEFSMFLRGNIDAISAPGTIPFEQELAHTKYYLELEKMRFDERLRVVYHIGPLLFRMPSLTLQPIVENAVRYGVSPKAEGGTVTISTAETADAWVITVEDDGVGFEPGKIPTDGRTHVGISNVRQRLMGQCEGTLTVTGTHGVGTTAVISIPKCQEIG